MSAAEWTSIGEVEAWDRNPRRITDDVIRRVAGSIRRFGFVAPLVVWAGRGRLVAGHARLRALQYLLREDPGFVPRGAPGPGVAPVRFHEFRDEREANAYALADNRLGEIVEWDGAALAEQLRDLDRFGVDLDDLGWAPEDYGALLGSLTAPTFVGQAPEAYAPTPLPPVATGPDDRALTVTIVYKTEEEAATLRRRLGIDPAHDFARKAVFRVRDVWGEDDGDG